MAAFDWSTQFRFKANNGWIENGEYSFTTTSLTVEVPTKLTKCVSQQVTPQVTSGDVTEILRCDKTITSGHITVTREAKPLTLQTSPEDAAWITGNDWVGVPVGRSPVAGTIVGFRVQNMTLPGGSPVIALGKQASTALLIDTTGGTSGFVVGEEVSQATSLTRGVVVSESVAGDQISLVVRTLEGSWTTGLVSGATASMAPNTHVPTATAAESFIDATNAWLLPEAGFGLDIREADITVGDAANQFTSITVAKGDMIMFGTTSGGSSDPSGLFVAVDIRPTATSGLTFDYAFYGH